jgi:hypothetical protein
MSNFLKIPSDHILYLTPHDHVTKIHAARIYLSLYNEYFDSTIMYGYYNGQDIEDFILKNIEGSEKIHGAYSITEDNDKVRNLHNSIIKICDRCILDFRRDELRICHHRDLDVSVYFDMFKKFIIQPMKESYFNVIAKSEYSDFGYNLVSFPIKDRNISIEKMYNDDMVPVDNEITKFLNDSDSNGFVLLHGIQGTGKTTYIRHLIKTIDSRFIYMPVHMASAMDSPHFLPFLINYPGSVLIIEDCEEIIRSRESNQGDNSGIANLLNIGDGLLSDALNLKVIITFNTNIEKIDKAILRKGRMKARYEFKELEANKVKSLLDDLGIKDVEAKPMTIADIFNATEMSFEVNDSKGKIGFGK